MPRVLKSAARPGEYFTYDAVSDVVIYYKPCGPLPIGKYIKGLIEEEIIRIDGVNYKRNTSMGKSNDWWDSIYAKKIHSIE